MKTKLINYFQLKDTLIVLNDNFGKEEEPTIEAEKKKFDEKEKTTNKTANFLQNDILEKKENCIFLIGAGASYTSGGPLMSDLWGYFIGEKPQNCNDKFFSKNSESFETFQTTYQESFKELLEELNHSEEDSNLEFLLSKLITYVTNENNLKKKEQAEGEEIEESSEGEDEENELINMKDILEKEIKKICHINLGDDTEFPYLLYFLTKIRGGSNKSRPKFFTLNYDTLIEQSAERYQYSLIDGFSFTTPRRFNSSNFDLDIIEKYENRIENSKLHDKVIHLYKLHGSLNWKKEATGEYIISNDVDSGEIIYPGKGKYEQSYDMPYFEMLTRFQFELRRKETVLNIIGYGFGDDHINRMIIEGLKNNSSLTLNIVGGNGRLYDINGEDFNLKILKELEPYINMKRVNFFDMHFWGFVNLLAVEKPNTIDEDIFNKIFPHLLPPLIKQNDDN